MKQLSKIDLNILRVLDALLMERSVTRAAERLRVTQQAVSGSLRRLRDVFRDPLLVRMGQHMELTPLAQILAQPVREALLELERILNLRPTFDAMTSARRFRIAMSDYCCFVVMPNVLKTLAEESPLITCEVSGNTEHSLAALARGDLDMVITVPEAINLTPDFHSVVRSRILFEDDFVCVADAGNELITSELTDEVYRRLPQCVARFGSPGGTLVERAWRECGFSPNVVSTGPGFSSVIFMLPGTAAVGTVQRKLASVLAPSLGLRIHDCPFPIGVVREYLYSHVRSVDDPVQEFLASVFARVAEGLPSDGHR